jgi:hypothetical protein
MIRCALMDALHRRWALARPLVLAPLLALLLVPASLLALLLVLPLPAGASEWGGIQPGVTTREQVNDRYGPPSKENRPKIEGYDTIQWVYENTRAPEGITRMTVDFGILGQSGFVPNLVRVLTLQPKPLIFGRMTLIQGWGLPDGISNNPDGSVNLLWKDGLFVTLNQEGEEAAIMVFSPPQPSLAIPPPAEPGAAAPKKPAEPGAAAPKK